MHLEETGLQHIIYESEGFIQEHLRYVIHAGDIILKKMQSSPTILGIHIGTKIEEKEKKPHRLRRLLSKIRLLPKLATSIEKVKIPVFYVENPYVEYRKRIEELEKEEIE